MRQYDIFQATIRLRTGGDFPPVKPEIQPWEGKTVRCQIVSDMDGDRRYPDDEWQVQVLDEVDFPLSWIASGDLLII
jgi:hypothetical protein